jgi:hypothetical protein
MGGKMKSWGITLNGEGIFGTYGDNNSQFSYNLTSIFNDNSIILNVGDVIDISIDFEGTLYFSKLIIKN